MECLLDTISNSITREKKIGSRDNSIEDGYRSKPLFSEKFPNLMKKVVKLKKQIRQKHNESFNI